MPDLLKDWQSLIIMLSVLSLIVGAFVAIVQDNLKRMLAYSGIGHMGFLLLGVIAATPDGYASAMFYVVIYAITGVAGFGVIATLSRTGKEFDLISDFKGLNARNPWLALMILMIMFSMAGVPPFIGFWAKLLVVEEIIQAGFLWLAVLAVIAAVISAFYYLKVIKAMYFDTPEDASKLEPANSRLTIGVSSIAILLLVLGLLPGTMIDVFFNSLNVVS